MALKMSAEAVEEKNKGNKAFKEGNGFMTQRNAEKKKGADASQEKIAELQKQAEECYETSLSHFTAAIALDSKNHVFYSNRSGVYVKLKKHEEALKDADQCISLNGEWAKGYGRRGDALLMLERFEEALETYQKGELLRTDAEKAKLTYDSKIKLLQTKVAERKESALKKQKAVEEKKLEMAAAQQQSGIFSILKVSVVAFVAYYVYSNYLA